MTQTHAYPGIEIRQCSPPLVGDAILALQLRLAALGFPCAATGTAPGAAAGDIAGVFGPRTDAALRAYQSAHQLGHDGIAGPHSWAALFDLPIPAPATPTQAATPPAAAPAAPPAAAFDLAAPHAPAPHAAPVDPNRRDTDLAHLHPAARTRVEALLADLHAAGLPMGVFEAFRSPERQRALFAQGRNAAGIVIDKRAVVTQARPFESYHQYGLGVDIVIQHPGTNPWDTSTAETRAWWDAMHTLARRHGLEPLSWEMPHVQVIGLSVPKLLQGQLPPGGDDSWADVYAAAIARWQGSPKPPPPGRATRPPIAALTRAPAAHAGWDALPRIVPHDWTSRFGGRRWRVDPHGVSLDAPGAQPLRTQGAPETCTDIVACFAPHIQAAAAAHLVPAELIVMVIAAEVGIYRKSRYTGPPTFRWEPAHGDYSAGPMQLMAGTARDVSARHALPHGPDLFPHFPACPTPPPDALPLYEPALSIDVGTRLIREIMDKEGGDPILVAAAYNAGSVRESTATEWHIHAYGDHLDRAAAWFGDACDVIEHLRS